MNATFIPGWDETNGNTNSFLYRVMGEYKCCEYVLGKPLSDAFIKKIQLSNICVIHSAGFWAFLVAYKRGYLNHVTKVVVFDGWYPETCKISELPGDGNIEYVFAFPTFGNRAEYPLETDVVRPAMKLHKNITVARLVGYGHNIMFGEVGLTKASELITNTVNLKNEGFEWIAACPSTEYIKQ